MLKEIRRWSLFILFVLIIIETVLFNQQDFIGAILMLYGWSLICIFVLRRIILIKFPVLFIATFGLGVSYFYFPLVATLLANRPITFGFKNPILTFFHQFIYITTYMAAFLVYTRKIKSPYSLRKFLFKYKFFKIPTDTQLWLMGFIGVSVYIYLQIIYGLLSVEADQIPPIIKFIHPLVKFCYAPILILFKDLFYTNFSNPNKSKNNIWIYIYMGGLIFLSFFGNGRQFMISSIILASLLFFYNGIYKNYSIKRFLPLKNAVIIVIVALIVLGPLTKMSYAMLMVRAARSNLSAIELFHETLRSYNSIDTHLITEKMIQAETGSDLMWNEDYTGNIFFDRFCNLKIADLTIQFNEEANMNTSESIDYLKNKTLSQIPSPLLRILHIKLDKNNSNVNYTVASILKEKTIGYGSGGKSVSAHTGTGIWLFGNFYPIVFFFLFLVFFFLFDVFVFKINCTLFYSPVLFLSFYNFFSFFNFKNGIVTDILFFIRPFWELCFLYILIFHITKALSKLIKK